MVSIKKNNKGELALARGLEQENHQYTLLVKMKYLKSVVQDFQIFVIVSVVFI